MFTLISASRDVPGPSFQPKAIAGGAALHVGECCRSFVAGSRVLAVSTAVGAVPVRPAVTAGKGHVGCIVVLVVVVATVAIIAVVSVAAIAAIVVVVVCIGLDNKLGNHLLDVLDRCWSWCWVGGCRLCDIGLSRDRLGDGNR